MQIRYQLPNQTFGKFSNVYNGWEKRDPLLQTLPSSWYPMLHAIRDVARRTLVSIGIRQELSESGMSGKNRTAFESTCPFQGKQHSSHYHLPPFSPVNETSDGLACQEKKKTRNMVLHLKCEISWFFKAWPMTLPPLYPLFHSFNMPLQATWNISISQMTSWTWFFIVFGNIRWEYYPSASMISGTGIRWHLFLACTFTRDVREELRVFLSEKWASLNVCADLSRKSR